MIEFTETQATTYGRDVEPEPKNWKSRAWRAWNRRKQAQWHAQLNETRDRALFSFLIVYANGKVDRNYVARYAADDWRAVSFRGRKPWGQFAARPTLHGCLDNIFSCAINDDDHWKNGKSTFRVLDDKTCPAHPWALWHQSEHPGETVCIWHDDEGTGVWWCTRCQARYLSIGGACGRCDHP